VRIRILDLAERDLIEGFRFYEAQETGLGSYFLTNLFADIESLRLYAGVHEQPFKSLLSPAFSSIPFRCPGLSQGSGLGPSAADVKN